MVLIGGMEHQSYLSRVAVVTKTLFMFLIIDIVSVREPDRTTDQSNLPSTVQAAHDHPEIRLDLGDTSPIRY